MATKTISDRKVNRISRDRAFSYLMDETGGLFFSAYFQKKDGSMRQMTCRRYVGKFLAGGELSYDPRARKHVPVVDINLCDEESNPHRMVNVQTLVSFNAVGETFLVVD